MRKLPRRVARWAAGRPMVGALVALALLGCGGGDRAVPGPLRVAVSVAPQRELVRRLGGERVRVTVMVPAGATPATYSPTPRQMVALEDAALYVAVGHPAFPFERRHLAAIRSAHPELPVVRMAAGLEPTPGPEHDHGAGGVAGDPHVWLSPRAVAVAAEDVARALIAADPGAGSTVEERLERLRAEVEGLDRDIRAALSDLPRRRLFVYHAAWGHYAADYGLEQVAIEEGGREPSPRRIAEIVRAVRASDTRVIFAQEGFSQRAARAVAREAGARVEIVDPLAPDWEANLRRVTERFRAALSE